MGTNRDSSTEDTHRTVYRVRMLHANTLEYCGSPSDSECCPNDLVVVQTRYGSDVGRIHGKVENARETRNREIRPLERKATPTDVEKYEENLTKEKETFRICRDKIAERGLDMKFVSAHHLLDESKILFFFVAESRVDFRELVRDLVTVFKTRIELRQIGVRDETRMHGGLGVCGRGFCCHSVTEKLNPVSIRMAKEQDLTLNSMKVSGPCGRLLCCLAYEYEVYRDAREAMPLEGARVRSADELFVVSRTNLLRRKVTLTSANGRVLEVEAEQLVRDDTGDGWNMKE